MEIIITKNYNSSAQKRREKEHASLQRHFGDFGWNLRKAFQKENQADDQVVQRCNNP
jgi:hypothetical protein